MVARADPRPVVRIFLCGGAWDLGALGLRLLRRGLWARYGCGGPGPMAGAGQAGQAAGAVAASAG